MVVRALNSDFGGEVNPRELLVLVKRFQELDKVMGDSGEVEGNDEVLARFQAVNRLLRRFTATPMILPGYLSDPDSAARGWSLSWCRTGRTRQPFREVVLVFTIEAIASAGRISSLKQCAHCRKWLYARFPHQRFCSGGKCQQEFHKFNEADKKRRRDWARANYQSRKELELGSRKAAQRKGGKR
ncbi:MAG: hypothetical protein WCF30_11465 [Terracidiphilus sp.]